MKITARLLALPLGTLLVTPAFAADKAAPVSAIVDRVNIPYESFTLANGLRVLVHTDRKAPVVALSVWYHVGSKDEPAGKTGFAHLFEHLMFNGSENSPGDFFEPLQQIGATGYNGTTWFDRTNYYETVPTPALERALFLESDRMGHLLGAVTQDKLTNQIGVVQNEKRQGDNEPFGTVEYITNTTLFPPGHPYHHVTIGAMRDLTGASLEDVKNWFRAKYGPNNAILVLAGDIDARTARPLVEKWFGAIPRGPVVTHPAAPVPTLPAPVTKVIKDRVPYTRIMRQWAVEGLNGKDTNALDAALTILGGLSSSRLDNAMVRGSQTALNVSASLSAFENMGLATISADVKPGQDPAKVGAELDRVVADFLANGPTADEVERVAMRSAAGTVGGLETAGGKASTLAEGLLYSNNPNKYKADLRALASLTPASVKAAARKWLLRPVFNLTIEPGPRDESPEMMAITGGVTPPEGRGPAHYADPARAPMPTMRAAPTKPIVDADRKNLPPLGAFPPLTLPGIERTRLANGIPVYFARRSDTPTVRINVVFDAGAASDDANALGTQALTLAVLKEGTTTRNSTQLAEEQERLGANISTGSSFDRTSIGAYALSPNLPATLNLLADVVRNPAFDPKEVDRMRNRQLGSVAAQMSSPDAIARMVMPTIIYGKDHPYGRPVSGLGTPDTLKAMTRDSLIAYQQRWLRPDNAAIFVTGDTTLAQLTPLLEHSFGDWRASATPKGHKTFTAIPAISTSKIYLVDMPGKPQSVIRGGQVISKNGTDDSLLTLRQANDVLGGAFLSRLNMDLRETKGWSYGVGSGIPTVDDRAQFIINAPVQADRTGESLASLISDVRDFLTTKGTTAEELTRTTNGSIRELPGSFETSGALLGAMEDIVLNHRPDNYYTTLAARYRTMTAADFDKAARAEIDPARMTWVVVGDAAKVRPQLEKLGLPIETVELGGK